MVVKYFGRSYKDWALRLVYHVSDYPPDCQQCQEFQGAKPPNLCWGWGRDGHQQVQGDGEQEDTSYHGFGKMGNYLKLYNE